MAKRKRKRSSALSRSIYVTGKCFMRYEMKKRCGIGRRKPKKKVTYSYIPNETINGRPVTYMCFEDYDVIVHTKDELEFMLLQGLKVDFQNDRYDVSLEKQRLNKEMLALYRKQKIEREKQKRNLKVMSIIAVGLILAVGINFL